MRESSLTDLTTEIHHWQVFYWLGPTMRQRLTCVGNEPGTNQLPNKNCQIWGHHGHALLQVTVQLISSLGHFNHLWTDTVNYCMLVGKMAETCLIVTYMPTPHWLAVHVHESQGKDSVYM